MGQLHDDVIADLEARYNKENVPGRKVFTNPGSEQNTNLGGDNWPDVIVWHDRKVSGNEDQKDFIVEVEDEFSEDHAADQWVRYSKLKGYLFCLVVPQASVAEARRILKKLGLSSVDLWGFQGTARTGFTYTRA